MRLHKILDTTTNTDNGAGLDPDQYKEMRNLSTTLSGSGVPFDLSGYSKGGGLAQEAGLVSPASQVYVFNSAGLSDASLPRTGNPSFDSLESRTTAYNAEGDFLTFMNKTTDPQLQIKNAQYLRDRLAGHGPLDPLSLDYRNPEMRTAYQDQQFAQQQLNEIAAYGGAPPADVIAAATEQYDPGFEEDRQKYLGSIDQMIAKAKLDAAAGRPFRLFPPVRAGTQETVDSSMTSAGYSLGAMKPDPNLGQLYQHQISVLADSMQNNVNDDRKAMQIFLRNCGG